MTPLTSMSRPRLMAVLASAAVVVAACVSTSPPAAPSSLTPPVATRETPAPRSIAAPTDDTAPMSSNAAAPKESKVLCELVCEHAEVVPRAADQPDYTAKATENANRVLEAMKGDLLTCYKKRILAYPQAQGFLSVQISVGDDGRVRSVNTTGGGTLGEGTIACVVKHIKRGVFEPHHGGGSMEIRVPFSMRRAVTGEEASL
jgi:hypothetical protein